VAQHLAWFALFRQRRERLDALQARMLKALQGNDSDLIGRAATDLLDRFRTDQPTLQNGRWVQ
jgi:hypothetical protein